MAAIIRLQIIGLSPEDIGSVSLEKLQEKLDAWAASLSPSDIGAIASDRIGAPGGLPFLDDNAKVPLHLLPDKLLTWDRFDAYGGVPKISETEPHCIQEWYLPGNILQRLAALEAKTANL
jgi:hypothetical protein